MPRIIPVGVATRVATAIVGRLCVGAVARGHYSEGLWSSGQLATAEEVAVPHSCTLPLPCSHAVACTTVVEAEKKLPMPVIPVCTGTAVQ